MHLGTYLAGLRKQCSITQTALAERLGVTRWTILDWEKGKVRIYADHLGRFLDVVAATPEQRSHATRLASGSDPDGLPADPPSDDEFHLDLDADPLDDIPHTTHGFLERDLPTVRTVDEIPAAWLAVRKALAILDGTEA